jgi:hypothetical protein
MHDRWMRRIEAVHKGSAIRQGQQVYCEEVEQIHKRIVAARRIAENQVRSLVCATATKSGSTLRAKIVWGFPRKVGADLSINKFPVIAVTLSSRKVHAHYTPSCTTK